MDMTNDKARVRFTFRMPDDIDQYLIQKANQWRTTKSGALTRIILEYSEVMENKKAEQAS